MIRNEPLNITILDIRPPRLKNIGEVSVLDIYDNVTGDFNKDGLYSSEIFGRPGSRKRNITFGKIKLSTSVIHPKLLRELFKLRSAYREIMEGRIYATFNEKLGDFEISDALSGETGYHFFYSKLDQLKLKRNNSDERNKRIDLFYAFKHLLAIDYLVVYPAGLRDITPKGKSREDEHEINKLYRSVISASKSIPANLANKELPDLDNVRISLQRRVNEVYEMLEDGFGGKTGFFRSKVLQRKVGFSQRNVISTFDPTATNLTSSSLLDIRYNRCGLYSYIKSTLPLLAHVFKTSLLSELCQSNAGTASFFDADNKVFTEKLTSKTISTFQTFDGLEKQVNLFSVKEKRFKHVKVQNGYPLLVSFKDKELHLIRPSDVQNGMEIAPDARPITWAELYYVAAQFYIKETAALCTRYPVLSIGSIVPCFPFISTTARFLTLKTVLNGVVVDLPEFPVTTGEPLVDTLQINPYNLPGLNADFDGDMMNFTVIMGKESVEAIRNLLGEANNYLSPSGGLRFTLISDSIHYTLNNFY